MPSEVMDIVGKLLVLASSPGGQAALTRIFAERGITKDVVVAAIDALPIPKDTKEV